MAHRETTREKEMNLKEKETEGETGEKAFFYKECNTTGWRQCDWFLLLVMDTSYSSLGVQGSVSWVTKASKLIQQYPFGSFRYEWSFLEVLTNKATEVNEGKPLPLLQKAAIGLTAGAIGIMKRHREANSGFATIKVMCKISLDCMIVVLRSSDRPQGRCSNDIILHGNSLRESRRLLD
ncbi:hypothetical protein HPP92_023709 [Vanilla planifolia]|uniref:Uncharacterized protein n=1 Tax=Vanilla planifolia TaxID=51239 RepID=A0A835UE09_VANPL|nr:hypothetical protein HPP92_023709 [Vanilla planifolia]